ncbi:hypothetical protein CTEN210_12602 [Chaetoceros tenuissimus]|uniref:Uncharacterized protein n=1 Tax=Chaetoceros tenuissimus TaxID=426638 RepID=A0AAD3D1I0_9STRA|nr:hypothetical protein CTEN210_12602 [Chaetoceros tenuissimus]
MSCIKHTHTSSTKGRGTKQVSFGFIRIREFLVCPGDSPSVSDGPPLSLSWEQVGESTVEIGHNDEQVDTKRTGFERNLSVSSELSLSNNCPRLSHTERRAILRNLGYSYKSIQESTNNAAMARREREKVATAYKMKRKRTERIKEFFHCKRGPGVRALLVS